MATLLVSLPDGEQSHDLTDDVITIGRVADNLIQIDDNSVSSHHAKIHFRDNRYELEDLDSTNGTRVNGQRQQKMTLNDGMKVRFGQIETTFHSGAGGEILPLPPAGEIDIKVGDQTRRPADFLNASPYGRRSGKKDGASAAVLAFGILAILIGLAAIYLAISITARPV